MEFQTDFPTKSKKVVALRNICCCFIDSGFLMMDIDQPTLIYNDNDACIEWSHNMTSKVVRHIELRKNSNREREWAQDMTISVKHLAGKLNPADIFTKEMRNDGARFCLQLLHVLAFRFP